MGLFSGLANIVSAPLDAMNDLCNGEWPIDIIKNAWERIDNWFKK